MPMCVFYRRIVVIVVFIILEGLPDADGVCTQNKWVVETPEGNMGMILMDFCKYEAVS